MNNQIYSTTIGDAALLVVGLLLQVGLCLLLIISGYWWLSLPFVFFIFYYLYKNPLMFTLANDKIISWYISGKKEYSFSDIHDAEIVSLVKGARGIKLKFSDNRKAIIEYDSITQCVYFLNLLHSKKVPIIKNRLWNKKINGDTGKGFYVSG